MAVSPFADGLLISLASFWLFARMSIPCCWRARTLACVSWKSEFALPGRARPVVLDFAREARVWTLGRCQYRDLKEMDMDGGGGLLRQEMDQPLEFLCLDH